MFYFLLQPKQGYILNDKLKWSRIGDCGTDGSCMALGLEMEEALRVAPWLSYDGVTAITYPEPTMLTKVEKMMGGSFDVAVHQMTHSEFELRVQENMYPAFLLRKPANRMEKKLLMRQIGRGLRGNHGLTSDASVVITKEQLTRNTIGKGENCVYYIVKPKKGMFLTKSLTWLSIEALKNDRKQLSQLFAIKNNITQAQILCQWVSMPGETVNPCSPSFLKRRFNVCFPNVSEDSLETGILTHRYPSFLSRKPREKKEMVAFHMELKNGLKGLEERMIKVLGAAEHSSTPAEPSAVGLDADALAVVELLASQYDEGEEQAEEDNFLSGEMSSEQICEFRNWSVPVAESSDLIREMMEVSMAFGRVMNEVPDLLARKKLDLEMIQRQLVDLDHMSEFYDLNVSDGCRLNKTRQEMLQKRRITKNEIFVLELACNYFDNGATPAKIHSFVSSITGMDRRRYAPRVMTASDIKKIVQSTKTQDVILGGQPSLPDCQTQNGIGFVATDG